MRSTHPRAFLVLLTLATCLLPACRRPAAKPVDSSTSRTGPVTVQIAGEQGSRSVVVDDVPDGTTVEALMRSLSDVPVEMRGRGATAFVHSIDGVATDSVSGWTYRVDGKFAERGVGETVLHPPTTIGWAFGGWDEQASP